MKLLKYILTVSLLAIIMPRTANACWYPTYHPGEYLMFRIYDGKDDGNCLSSNQSNDNRNRNLKEWQKITGKNIPLADIEAIIYDMPLKEFQNLYLAKGKGGSKNKFAAWIIKHDKQALDYLLLAKHNEYLRQKQNSRWYYPTMNTGCSMSLEEVASKAMASKSSNLHSRYMLQAVRALFTLKRYDECIAIWNGDISKLPKENLMRRHIAPYIAGAKRRLGNIDEAIALYAETGDTDAILQCTKDKVGDGVYEDDDYDLDDATRKKRLFNKIKRRTEEIEIIFRNSPNNIVITKKLQGIITEIEVGYVSDKYCFQHYSGPFNWHTRINTNAYDRLYSLCFKFADDKRCENPAMWYYTAAFLDHCHGRHQQASAVLRKAENAKGTGYLKESIKMMRIFLDAKLMPYNKNYERHLLEQLKWIDGKITATTNANQINSDRFLYDLRSSVSQHYWNDMLRRLTFDVLVPKMLKCGNEVRALQMANMACNRMTIRMNSTSKLWCSRHGKTATKIKYWRGRKYRVAYMPNNAWDYSNHFFALIDTIGVKHAIGYRNSICHNGQGDELTAFLNKNSYTYSAYINDIIGTKLLRDMRYEEALAYLEKVPASYGKHQNVRMWHYPFSLKRVAALQVPCFKLGFAREMCKLEKLMGETDNPNLKAQYLFKYAVGMHNSFNRSWQLTQYLSGEHYSAPHLNSDWPEEKHTKDMHKRARRLITKACSMATDREVAAELHYKLCHFKTVAQQYGDTRLGILVKGNCDKLIDYSTIKD